MRSFKEVIHTRFLLHDYCHQPLMCPACRPIPLRGTQVATSPASRAGGRPVIVVGDVCAQGGPAQIAEASAALGGRVDILVNNAGGARPVTGEATSCA